MLYTSPEDWLALMSSASKRWTQHARHAALGLILLACSSSLASSAPGQANALTVLFSPGAGTFVGSETVTLSAQARADIHYTLDGSLPTVTSPIYQGPLTLDTSTRLRAFAIVPGAPGSAVAGTGQQGPVATEVYLRVDRDAQSFTSHLPIILIHTFESGKLDSYGTDHVPAAIVVLEPQSGTNRLVGRAALDSRIGIHVRGESSRALSEEAIRRGAARRRRGCRQRPASARAARQLRLGVVRPAHLRSGTDQERARLRPQQPHRALRAAHALRRSVHGRRPRRRARRELSRVLHPHREDHA